MMRSTGAGAVWQHFSRVLISNAFHARERKAQLTGALNAVGAEDDQREIGVSFAAKGK
jgi:hypothetical protein